MNAPQSTLLRALRALGHAALFLTVFEACSNDEASEPLQPPGPASVEITGIALGQGFVGGGEATSILACDYTIGVNVLTTNWTLFGPGRCGGALQCGQLRVSLLDLDGLAGAERLWVIAAGNGVALDVHPLLSATPPLQDGRFAVKVELVDDAGKPYVAPDGSKGSTEQEFDMKLPGDGDCASPTAPGSAGGGGAGGGGAGGGGAGGGSTGGGGASGGGGSAGASGAGASGAAGGSAGGDSAGAAGGSAAGGSAGGDSAGGGNAGAAGIARTAGRAGV